MSSESKAHDCVRVKVKHTSSDGAQSYCQFSIDINVTNFDTLSDLVRRHFEIANDFSMSYLVTDKYGEQAHMPLQSNPDLHQAMVQCHDLTLRLFVEVKADEDWDIVGAGEVAVSRDAEERRYSGGNTCVHNDKPSNTTATTANNNNNSTRRSQPVSSSSPAHLVASSIRSAFVGGNFLQSVSQHFEKTLNNLEKVMGLKSSNIPPRMPINDAEFRHYMDNQGRIVQPAEFHRNVYLGGIEPSLRKVAWRILLKIYPPETTGRERIGLLSSRITAYDQLKATWKTAYREGRLTRTQLEAVSLASVDVVRTDRNHPFYVNDGNNPRIFQLFNILATYAIYHPDVGYHQGMSNLASPLLYVQDNEGAAYVCFCALMSRLSPKFAPRSDQLVMIVQMQHLHDLLVFTDYELAQFLRRHHLGNMFFTERWLLLELVREFAFEEALHVSEVLWASLALTSASWPPTTHNNKFASKLSPTTTKLAASPAVGDDSIFESSDTQYTRCDVKLINSLVGDSFVYRNKNSPTSSSSLRTNAPPRTPRRRRSDESSNIWHGDPVHMKDWVVELPPPDELGGKNPFLLFICVAMLLEYREEILMEVREASDLFHLFQRKTKQHNAIRILNRARGLFDAYLNDQDVKRRGLVDFPGTEIKKMSVYT